MGDAPSGESCRCYVIGAVSEDQQMSQCELHIYTKFSSTVFLFDTKKSGFTYGA